MSSAHAPAPQRPQFVDEAAYARLAEGLRSLMGIDIAQYRAAQMWRRVSAFGRTRGLADPDALLAACRHQPQLLTDLRDMITINVSRFFRDEPSWEALAQRLRPRLRGPAGVRAWSAGCSIGLEPYSLAMLAREIAPGTPLRIVATDVDRAALEVARAGHYPALQTAGVSPERRKRFFLLSGAGWTVRPEVRATVTFRQHDLMAEPVGRHFELILCRNVVIYFTQAAKSAVHERLAGALRRGGLLFVGATEAILYPERYGLASDGPGFYVRVE